MTMTFRQKEERRDARRLGEKSLIHLAHALTDQREADTWFRVLGLDCDHGRMWRARADQHADEAARYARWAAHHAALSLET